MARTLEQIEDEVLHLPEDSRAKLMGRLLQSFEVEQDAESRAVLRAWTDEAERRDREMDRGAEAGVPADEVFRKLRSTLP
ncbi:MAG TPA: addiction module protein [Thermoanaerobaculia bacterium]